MIRRHAMLIDAASALVERPAEGQAPTAFRVWAAGENMCDDGPVFFTEESARLLMAEQEARARVYSIDFDHLSLTANRPAESGRAAGWHVLEVRPDADGAPELWTARVEWCADAKAGLEETPPRWRFFSPAFLTNEDGEVTSYINLALCINPLTHALPSLAARTSGDDMDKKTLLAALAALVGDGSDDEKKEAKAKLAEFLEGLDDDKDKEKKAEEEKEPDEKAEEPPPSSKPEEQEKKADEPPAPKPPEGPKDKDEKTEAKAAAANMASDLVEATKRIEALEVSGLLGARPDLPESVRRWCASQSVAVVKSFLSASPRATARREEKPTVGGAAGGAPTVGLQGAELEQLNQAMGIRPPEARGPQKLADGRLVLHTMRPTEFRAECAKSQKGAA